VSRTSVVIELLSRGDVYYNVSGLTKEEALSSFVRVAKIPRSVDRSKLAMALQDREALTSTAIGNGYAIPHPRMNMIPEKSMSSISIAYLEKPLDWDAYDKKSVSILFMLLSHNSEQHLFALSGLAFLANDKEFNNCIEKRPGKDEILEFLSSSY
jgi:PTS system nitrogen regulatory IIA component